MCCNGDVIVLSPMTSLQRLFREFTDFFFMKGNALNLAIAVVVGTQFQQIVDALTKDLLMPLINPFIQNGGWQKWVIPYGGGNLLIGDALNVLLNSLIVGWVLFLIVKTINRSQRIASSGIDRVRGHKPAEVTPSQSLLRASCLVILWLSSTAKE